MTIDNLLVDDKGNIAVWGHQSASGKPYYTFKLTDTDEFVMFPNTSTNPKAPKFTIKLRTPKEVAEA